MNRTWSPQQLDIFRWFESGAGHLVVRARAGTGKTTTILEGIEHAPEPQILLAAFNKRIAEELQAKLRNPRAEACTLHGAGFRIVRRFWERTQIAQGHERANGLAKQAVGDQAPDAILSLVAKLCTLGREMAPFATSGKDLEDIALAHDCEPDPEWEEDGWDLEGVSGAAFKAMQLAKQRPAGGIDFSDMLYLPLANGWVRARYDLVVIDEAQDMNAAQIALARRLSKGRVVVVGDDRQGIYGFRGADSGALDRLKAELSAQELGLTTTYRCGKSIVALAAQWVPDYAAAPTNPDGLVRSLPREGIFGDARMGDAVLSRTNAELISLCLRCLKNGVAARIEGKDVAEGLRALVKKLSTGKAANSVPMFLERLRSWQERETARASKMAPDRAEAKVEQICDKAEALANLCDGIASIAELRTRIDRIFDDIQGGRCVLFSSVHKAKGLEWDRVYVLRYTLRDRPQGDKPVRQEELNIAYVAVTRAKGELVMVDQGGVEPPAPALRVVEAAP